MDSVEDDQEVENDEYQLFTDEVEYDGLITAQELLDDSWIV